MFAMIAVAVLAGEPQCWNSPESCNFRVGDGTFGIVYEKMRGMSSGSFPYDDKVTDQERDLLCSAANWNTALQCRELCPFRLTLTAPASLAGETICIADNEFRPYILKTHIDQLHPLHGNEYEILNLSASDSSCSAGAAAASFLSNKIALLASRCYDAASASTIAAGSQAVMSLMGSSSNTNAMRVFPKDGLSSAADIPSMIIPTHWTRLLWEQLDAGVTIKGKISLVCDALPQLTSPGPDGANFCPYFKLRGLCDFKPDPNDRLCSKCPIQVSGIAGLPEGGICIWGNSLSPMKDSTFLERSIGALPKTVTNIVVATTLPNEGCDKTSFDGLGGRTVIVKESSKCLAHGLARNAAIAGVAMLIVAPRSSNAMELISVEGPSRLINIPIHSIYRGDYDALLAIAEAGAKTSFGYDLPSTKLSAGISPPQGAALPGLTPNITLVAEETEKLSDWDWSPIVCICIALLGIEVGVLIVYGVTTRKAQKHQMKQGKGLSIPLGVASTGLSVSLLLTVAVVAFALAYAAGKDSTDTAIEDGKLNTKATYDNAADNVDDLAAQMRTVIIGRALEGLSALVSKFESISVAHSAMLRDFDGTWAELAAVYPKIQALGQSTDGTIKAHFLTKNGFFASKNVVSDWRTEAERWDGQIGDVATNNTGFAYGVRHIIFGDFPGWVYSEDFPAYKYNASNILASSRMSPYDIVDENALSNHVWYVSRRIVDVYPITSGPSLSMVTAFTNKNGQYLGTIEANDRLSVVGSILKKSVGGGAALLTNMTVFLVDSADGTIIADDTNGNAKTEADFTRVNQWGVAEVTTVARLFSVNDTPIVHIRAFSNYIYKQENGFVDHSGSFDQKTEYFENPQAPGVIVASLEVINGEIRDVSGSGLKAESRGGGCGGCVAVDSILQKEVMSFDGSNVLHIYNNLTTENTYIKATRASPANAAWASTAPEYDASISNPDGSLRCVAQTYMTSATQSVTDCYHVPSFTHVRQFSVSMKVNPSVTAQSNGYLFSQTLEGETNVRVTSDGRMFMNILNYGCVTEPYPGGFPADKWTTVTAVSGIAEFGYCSVYVDGKLFSTSISGTVENQNSQSHAYYVGNGFKGKLDGIVLFDTTLSDKEVMSLHQGSFVRDVPSKIWYSASKVMEHKSGRKNLNWAVVSMIPREDIMREVDQNNIKTSADVVIQEANTSAKLNRKTGETALILTVIALFSVIIFLVFNHLLTRPFATYAALMNEAAVMNIDELPAGESFISELRAMNKAMTLMLANLKEYRSYMPQSLQLLALTDAETSEEVDVEEGRSIGPERLSTNRSSRKGGSGRSQSGTPSLSYSSHSGAAAAKITTNKRQELMCTLVKKRFTFTAINVKGWHQMVSRLTDEDIITTHAAILHKVLGIFVFNKGISEAFSGDRFVCTFNAAKQVGAHRFAGCVSANMIQDKLRDDHEMAVSCSVVSGDGRVGNLGNELMKRFTFITPVVTWGYALERFCREHDLTMLADVWTYEDVSCHFKLKIIDEVDFPKRYNSPIKVAELLGRREGAAGGGDEWMYELEVSERTCGFKTWNDWVKATIMGKVEVW